MTVPETSTSDDPCAEGIAPEACAERREGQSEVHDGQGGRSGKTTVSAVDLGELGVHRFEIEWAGVCTRVRWTSENLGEFVLIALGAPSLECDETASVIEDLLRTGAPLAEAIGWAQLDIRPRRPHFMVVWKVPDRRRDFHHVDAWRREGIGPDEVLARGLCPRRGPRTDPW